MAAFMELGISTKYILAIMEYLSLLIGLGTEN